jgi:hypothetical protein
MPTLPRSISISKVRERPFSSRIEYYNSLHTHNIPTSQRRRIIGRTRIETGIRSHNRLSQ